MRSTYRNINSINCGLLSPTAPAKRYGVLVTHRSADFLVPYIMFLDRTWDWASQSLIYIKISPYRKLACWLQNACLVQSSMANAYWWHGNTLAVINELLKPALKLPIIWFSISGPRRISTAAVMCGLWPLVNDRSSKRQMTEKPSESFQLPCLILRWR